MVAAGCSLKTAQSRNTALLQLKPARLLSALCMPFSAGVNMPRKAWRIDYNRFWRSQQSKHRG